MQRPNEQQQRLPSWAINYPVPPSTNQYRLLLAQYHKVPTSTTTYCPSTTKYQPVPPCTDQVSSYINHYHPKLTQYHQVPARTGPESPRTNQYCPIRPSTIMTYQYPPIVTIKTSDILWKMSFLHILFSNSTVRLSFVDLR